MSEQYTIWDGFESEFFGSGDTSSLAETQPASLIHSSVADNRQILNILFLIDVSGSMRGQRIAQVNYALENIFKELRRRDDTGAVIKIGIMEFSEDARWVTPMPVPMEDYLFTQVDARLSLTSYGKAFEALRKKLRRDQFMNPALGEYFAPLILFITDGEPVDVQEYPAALKKLRSNGWFEKSSKYAIAVGEEARSEEIGRLLAEFTGLRENVRYADEGEALCELIEFIAIRASEVQTSMVSASAGSDPRAHSIFSDVDGSLFSSLYQ